MQCGCGLNYGSFAERNDPMTKAGDVCSVAPSVDVVIVNYNAGQYILDLVCLLKKNKCFNVCVVDNGSYDGSLQSLKNANIHVIENSDNKGFAVACNQGAKFGNADCMAFINPDCLLKSGQIEGMVGRLKEHSLGLIGCHVVDIDGKTQRGSWRRLPNLWRVLITVSGIEKLTVFQGLNLKVAPQIVEAVNGACFVVKRTVFEDIKGFDECFPLHFEDLDLFKRILDSGQKLGYASEISVKHIKGHSSRDNQQVELWKKQGLIRYFKKHRPRWEYKFIQFLVGLK